MSDFFDKLKKGAKEATEKAGILAKIAGLKTQIANINLKKDGLFKELGKAFFNEVKDGTFKGELSDNLKKIIDEINSLDAEIEKLNGEITKLNEDLKKVGATEEGLKEASQVEPAEQPKPSEEPKPTEENKENPQS